MSSLRILLADDHLLVRAGIRSLLEGIEHTSIVAETDNGREAVDLARALQPDLAVMDITMRGLNGIDATAQIRLESPATRVLILSMHSTEEFVTRAIKAGAHGYLVKDCAPEELKTAVQAVMRDEVYLSPRVSRHVVNSLLQGAQGGRRESPLDALTGRQREILQMIAEGKSTKEIAFVLDVSLKTVETHRKAVMQRLGIHDVAGLVVFAIRSGLIDIHGARG
jgi:DNA-binding NarL/FixJ family response regulator